MTLVYKWDERGLYSGSEEVDEAGPLPQHSTLAQPPEVSGDQVAQWQGDQWRVLESSPGLPPASAPDWPSLIAARRYDSETAGTTVQGVPIDTGRDSQGLITGAALQAVIDSDYSLHWKTSAGFVELTAEQVIGVATAVRAHVQASFNREAELLQAAADGTIAETMLEEGWPT